MITVRVDGAIKELKKGFEGLSKPQVAKATSQAINQTLLLGRTEARRAVKKVYNIPQRYLSGVNIKRANPGFLQGNIHATSKPIPMDAFNPKFEFLPALGGSSILTISKRGVLKHRETKRTKNQVGVNIEVKKGQMVNIPYAFLISGAKPRVFARGQYQPGDGSYGFIQRHSREENSHGNDSVKPLVSITVFGTVVNPLVKQDIKRVVEGGFSANMIKALKRQAGLL